MGSYVTPAGVVIEMNDEAAKTIGFKPADKPAESKASGRKPASSKSDK